MSCRDNNQSGKCTGHTLTSDLIHTATVAFNSLSDEEQTKVLSEQRASWLNGTEALRDPEKVAAAIRVIRSVQPHVVETPDTAQDIQYYLARVEGQIARLDYLLEHKAYTEAKATLNSTKAFLASLRNALDPRRIDVA